MFALVWASPFWMHAGQCIIGLHDWGWMCYPAQALNQFVAAVAPWNENNLGHTAVLPSTSPVALAAPALALLAPHFALATVLTAAVFVALIGCSRLLRCVGVTSFAAEALASAMYVTSPFFVTKLVSGHVGFILALAVLPFAFQEMLALSKGETRSPYRAVLLAAISASQLQIGCLLLICSAVVFRLPLRQLAAIWGAVALTYLPSAFITIAALLTGAVDHPLQLPAWVASQSVPLMHAFDAESYFAHYYADVSNQPSRVFFAVAGIVSALVLIVRGGLVRRLALTVAVLAVFAAGSRGPAAGIVVPLLIHVPASGVFRELYDLLALVPITTSIGTALLIESLPLPAAASGLLAAALACVAGAPWLTHAIGRELGFRDPARWQAQVAFVLAQKGHGRVLWLPGVAPITLTGRRSGADPFDTPFGGHASANAYDASGLFAYVAALGDAGEEIPDDLATRTGIGIVVSRPGIWSTRSNAIRNDARFPVARHYTSASVAAFAEGEPACEPDFHSKMAGSQIYVSCGNAFESAQNESNTDLTDGWVDRRLAPYTDPQLEDPRWPVLITRSKAVLRFTSTTAEILWLRGAGKACLDDTCDIVLQTRWRPYRMSPRRHELRLTGNGTVAEFRAPVTVPASHAGAIEHTLKIANENAYFGYYKIVLPPHKAGWLVLREGWSPLWRLRAEDVRMRQAATFVDGYASGWRVSASARPSTITAIDIIAIPYGILLLVSWGVWVLLVVAATQNKTADSSVIVTPSTARA